MNNTNAKLLLFDIDGTLLTARGVPKKAMKRVLQKRFNYFKYDDTYNYSGRTDWEIVDHLLDYGKIDYPRDFDSLNRIFSDFALELEKDINNGMKPKTFPGVTELIDKLNQYKECILSLLTGNIAEGARIKLQAVDLFHYFESGAFGDDAKQRNDLADIAINRIEQNKDIKISRQNTWIIGDSIYDVRCAKANQLRSMAVCTGITPREQLENENPEIIVDNFENTDKIIEIILDGKN